MKKIFTGLALVITTLPVFANDVQMPVPTTPAMPSATMMTPKLPAGQMQAPQIPNMNQFYGGNNGSNWTMPNMNWGNNGGNGSSWKMPNMNWGNNGGNGTSWKMPSMNWGNNGGNGTSWKMPNMNWGNNGGNGTSWKMPNMNWGNNGGNGSNWRMPNMNWGNNNSGWNGVPMYMAVPMAPRAPIMRPVAPQMNAPQQASVVTPQQKAMESQPVKKLSAADIVKHKIEQMKRLNAAIAKQLAGTTAKETPKVEAPAVAK